MAVTIDGTTGLTNIPAGNIAATNIQNAINELDAEKAFLSGSSSQPFNCYSLNDGQLGAFRNKIINGDMMVSQVNGGTAVTPSVIGVATYILDQWAISQTLASKLTFQQVVDAPAGFKYSTKIIVAVQTAPGASDRMEYRQPIEGQNLVDLQLGKATAATITVSLYIKGSVVGTYACSLFGGGGRSYVGTIMVTTSWAKQTVVLVGDVSGTWATDNTAGLTLSVDLGSGTIYNTTAGIWQAGTFLRIAGSVTFVNQVAGSTLNITGVQLEQVSAGATQGTAFEHVPYATQLAWCQRYLPVFNSTGGLCTIGSAAAYSTAAYSYIALPVATRVPVTAVVVNNPAYLTFASPLSGYAVSSMSLYGQSTLTSVATQNVISTVGAVVVAGSYAFSNAAGQLYFTGAQM